MTTLDRITEGCPEGHTILVSWAKRLSDLQPGDIITGHYRPSEGRGSTRIEAGISFARYVADADALG